MTGKLWIASWVTIFLLIAFQLSTAGGQTKITVGVAAMSPRTIPLLIAQQQGLFAKQGIEARIVLIKGAPYFGGEPYLWRYRSRLHRRYCGFGGGLPRS